MGLIQKLKDCKSRDIIRVPSSFASFEALVLADGGEKVHSASSGKASDNIFNLTSGLLGYLDPDTEVEWYDHWEL
jgi:hypothetical protein